MHFVPVACLGWLMLCREYCKTAQHNILWASVSLEKEKKHVNAMKEELKGGSSSVYAKCKLIIWNEMCRHEGTRNFAKASGFDPEKSVM